MTWTGSVKLGLAVAAVAAAAMPVGRLLAQQPAAASAPAPVSASGGDAAPADEARIAKGREIFASWSCTSCHSLADAGSHGDVGPHLDGGALTEPYIVSRVTNGQGAMPSFGGQLTKDEIADVAYYIVRVAKK